MNKQWSEHDGLRVFKGQVGYRFGGYEIFINDPGEKAYNNICPHDLVITYHEDTDGLSPSCDLRFNIALSEHSAQQLYNYLGDYLQMLNDKQQNENKR